MSEISLVTLNNAIQSLSDGFIENPSDLERDGIIQRFEFTCELCWKSGKKVLAENGISAESPKAVFREMAKIEWIDSAEPWIEYLKARNLASHVYNNEIAKRVFSIIPRFIDDAKILRDTLKGQLS